MYQIYLTPKNTNFKPHVWKEGGEFKTRDSAEFHASQIRITKEYSEVTVMPMIKLLKVDEMADGTQRFQSQLYVGRSTCDFVMGTDGIMKCYGRSEGRFDFFEYDKLYEIVSDKAEMRTQEL